MFAASDQGMGGIPCGKVIANGFILDERNSYEIKTPVDDRDQQECRNAYGLVHGYNSRMMHSHITYHLDRKLKPDGELSVFSLVYGNVVRHVFITGGIVGSLDIPRIISQSYRSLRSQTEQLFRTIGGDTLAAPGVENPVYIDLTVCVSVFIFQVKEALSPPGKKTEDDCRNQKDDLEQKTENGTYGGKCAQCNNDHFILFGRLT